LSAEPEPADPAHRGGGASGGPIRGGAQAEGPRRIHRTPAPRRIHRTL